MKVQPSESRLTPVAAALGATTTTAIRLAASHHGTRLIHASACLGDCANHHSLTSETVFQRKRRNPDALGELRSLVSSTEAQSRLLTTTEAAEFLRVNRRTVVNWIERGVVPYVELPGRSGGRHRYRIPLEGLLDSLGGNYDLTAELEAL